MSERFVRARYKASEHLPKWAKCCSRFTESLKGRVDMIVDLSAREAAVKNCAFCGADHGVLHGVMDIADRKLEAVELLDLDEGFVEAVSA